MNSKLSFIEAGAQSGAAPNQLTKNGNCTGMENGR